MHAISTHLTTPNYLIELGYAVKVLGWERIICIYNSDFGNFSELPFDLRFRRPLSYCINNNEKAKVRTQIAEVISNTITELDRKGLINDEISDFIKEPIDTEILTIINHLSKMIFGYEEDKSFAKIRDFLKLDFLQIKEHIKNKSFLGFQVFKNFEEIGINIRNLLNSLLSTSTQQRELSVILIKLINWIESYNKFISLRSSPNMFVCIDKISTNYISIYGPDLNPTNKNGYILLEKVNNKSGKVIDFGNFQEKDKIDKQLEFHEINMEYLEEYSIRIQEFINIVDKWLENTNDTFLIDTEKHFEISHNSHLKFGNELIKSSIDDLWRLFEFVFRFNFERKYSLEKLFFLNFMKLFTDYGYVFSNQKELLNKLNLDIITSVNCQRINAIEDIIIIPKGVNEEEVVVNGLDRLQMAKKGEVELKNIYLDNNLNEYINALVLILRNDKIIEVVRIQVFKVLQLNLNNITLTMTEILKTCLIDFVRTDDKEGYTINIPKAYNKFLRKKNSTKEEIKKLKDLIFNEMKAE